MLSVIYLKFIGTTTKAPLEAGLKLIRSNLSLKIAETTVYC